MRLKAFDDMDGGDVLRWEIWVIVHVLLPFEEVSFFVGLTVTGFPSIIILTIFFYSFFVVMELGFPGFHVLMFFLFCVCS